MVIKALDSQTTKLLCSTVNIVSSRDIVKELIDNSIDAGAMNIHVHVSSNCLDKIRVQDNGNGIDPLDFKYIAMPSHTSKLDTTSQLDRVGNKSLGFRGIALASINTISRVEIITKSKSAPVATKLTIRPGLGGFTTAKVVSSPKGTTVVVQDIFQNIRELIKSFALAHIDIGFSLKVFDDGGFPWRCVPSTPASFKETAIQILGKELGAASSEHQFICPTSLQDGKSGEQKCILHAVLPDLSQMHAKLPEAVYISIDGRGITATKGLGKALYENFKGHFSKATSDMVLTTDQKPFMCLNILTTNVPYDANLTPMKDEILFPDEEIIKNGFNSLCLKVYGHCKGIVADDADTDIRVSNHQKTTKIYAKLKTDFVVDMAWKKDEDVFESDGEGEALELIIPYMTTLPKTTDRTLRLGQSLDKRRRIEDYFTSKPEEFQVLSENNEPRECNSPCTSSPILQAGRKVLQPLTASSINSMQEEGGCETENSDTEEESHGSPESQLLATNISRGMIMETPTRIRGSNLGLLTGSASRAERITFSPSPMLQSPPPSVSRGVARPRREMPGFMSLTRNSPIRVSRAPMLTGTRSGGFQQGLVTPVRRTQPTSTPRFRLSEAVAGSNTDSYDNDGYLAPLHTQARQTQPMLLKSPKPRPATDTSEGSDSSSIDGDECDLTDNSELDPARVLSSLLAVICTDVSAIKTHMWRVASYDRFVQHGLVAFGEQRYEAEVLAELEAKIHRIIRLRMQ
ncbi:hypothetical protein VHEMI06428 [[Torrubiella] hemipterigena]|uniref:DNA mismatch repair protein S5 domain-containing protein n=1 Tax=[Torrubiella] hemipterigena TaxID=1531966 RepID=A0A0A1T0M5_9HYPO|nr:hypothetical protein VHEMI06428 [[Torrubiella] hemipterigena]